MTVKELSEKLGLEPLSVPDGNREVCGGYAGDLLSWVMGRAKSGDAWVTIMSNINVVAVATLRDVSCVILAENSEVENKVLEKAAEENVNVFRSPDGTFDLCSKISELLK